MGVNRQVIPISNGRENEENNASDFDNLFITRRDYLEPRAFVDNVRYRQTSNVKRQFTSHTTQQLQVKIHPPQFQRFQIKCKVQSTFNVITGKTGNTTNKASLYSFYFINLNIVVGDQINIQKGYVGFKVCTKKPTDLLLKRR